ncbi:MAG: DUF6503 family protein [Flammeovirgaceae bacterium]
MKYRIHFLLLIVLMSCQQKQTDQSQLLGQEVWEKVVEIYDPHQRLMNSAFRATFEEGTNPNNIGLQSSLLINHAKRYCQYTRLNLNDSSLLSMVYHNGKCMAIVNQDTLRTEEEMKAQQLSCATIAYYGTYYLYILGLPATLRATDEAFPDTVREGQFLGKRCLVFPIKYPKEIERERWTYYLDPTSYQIIGASYDYPDKPGAFGELKGVIATDSFSLIQTHDWYKADSSTWGHGKFTSLAQVDEDTIDWLLE